MKPKWQTSIMCSFILVTGSPVTGQDMYAFPVPLCRKTFLKTTEHTWTKTILSRGCRRKNI